MVDKSRQVPAPSASAWSIHLAGNDGPVFIVLRGDEHRAREALVEHLVAIGSVLSAAEAERIVAEAPTDSVAVIW